MVQSVAPTVCISCKSSDSSGENACANTHVSTKLKKQRRSNSLFQLAYFATATDAAADYTVMRHTLKGDSVGQDAAMLTLFCR
jgi:hypothetical protein